MPAAAQAKQRPHAAGVSAGIRFGDDPGSEDRGIQGRVPRFDHLLSPAHISQAATA